MTPSTGISEETKQILISLSRVEENMKHILKQMDDFSKVSDVVIETQASVKSAHIRIDDMKKDYDEKIMEQKKDYDEKLKAHKEVFNELKNNIVWLQRAVLGGFIGGFIGLIFFAFQWFVQN